MSDTDRLYALTSVYTHPWLGDEDGPGLLIGDAVLAMRWYLTSEREETLAVTGHVSEDSGATWRPLTPGELLADAERSLATTTAEPDATELLRRALWTEAADWLDHRIRYVEPDDPNQWRPETPELDSWRRGGQIWAMSLGTVPDDTVLTQLAAHYRAPQPEGPELLKAAARDTLKDLAIAEAPRGAGPGELLSTWRRLSPLTFRFGIGQVNGRVRAAKQRLMDHLVVRHRDTASVIAAHPDPQHPAHQAARAYLSRLAYIEPADEEGLRADARDAFEDALQEATTAHQPEEAVGEELEAQPVAAIPGYPKPLQDYLRAAAAWRLISPAARRDAEQAMDQLVRANTHLLQVTTSTADRIDGWPRAVAEKAAFQARLNAQRELDELNARHAMLMHGTVLADAEAAAESAAREAIVAAAQATDPPPGERRTVGHDLQVQDAFKAQVTAAEERIAQTLGEQRQLARDALHRLFPQASGSAGLYMLRTKLVEHSGLGIDAYTGAYCVIGELGGKLRDLESRLGSGYVEFGHRPVTAELVEQVRRGLQGAVERFEDLRVSRPATLRAVKALDSVAGLHPRSDGIAARAGQIAAQSRERTRRPTTPAPRRDAPTGHAQHQHQQAPHTGQSTRLP